jgi:hypothetical protein
VTEPTLTSGRQATVNKVFGFLSVSVAAYRCEAAWDAAHPDRPLHFGALAHGLLADMNASLPESFSIEDINAVHITGPDLPLLPDDWTTTAQATFQSMDLHLETYTKENVKAWRAKGEGGYPWPPSLELALLVPDVVPETVENFPNDGHVFWCKGAGHEGNCRRGVLNGTERPSEDLPRPGSSPWSSFSSAPGPSGHNGAAGRNSHPGNGPRP